MIARYCLDAERAVSPVAVRRRAGAADRAALWSKTSRRTLSITTDGLGTIDIAVRPIPLTLVYAPRDPMVTPVVGDRLRALVPDARFVKLTGGSHFAHVDAAFLAGS